MESNRIKCPKWREKSEDVHIAAITNVTKREKKTAYGPTPPPNACKAIREAGLCQLLQHEDPHGDRFKLKSIRTTLLNNQVVRCLLLEVCKNSLCELGQESCREVSFLSLLSSFALLP